MVKRPHGQSVLGVILTSGGGGGRAGGSTSTSERKFMTLVLAERPTPGNSGGGDSRSSQSQSHDPTQGKLQTPWLFILLSIDFMLLSSTPF